MSNNRVKTTANKGVLSRIKLYMSRNRLGELLVLSGVISSAQLHSALKVQKKTQRPLGAIFLESSAISRRQLALILGRQTATRMVMAAMICFVSLSFGKKARADMIKDIPSQFTISQPLIKADFNRAVSYPALFGSKEKRSSNLTAFTKWTGMFESLDRAVKKPSSGKILKQWHENLSGFQGLPLDKMAVKVNTMMNSKRYISDSNNWGKTDYWGTPIEFMARGGDCEDYAIAKYTALRSLGIPDSRLRLAIVHDIQKNIPHAVLVVYTDDGALILDNQVDAVRKASRVKNYRPIFSINRSAWWLHTASDSTRIASAR